MTSNMQYHRCRAIISALTRAEAELQIVWSEAYTDLPLPDRDDELADFCSKTLERLRALRMKAIEAAHRNQKSALRGLE